MVDGKTNISEIEVGDLVEYDNKRWVVIHKTFGLNDNWITRLFCVTEEEFLSKKTFTVKVSDYKGMNRICLSAHTDLCDDDNRYNYFDYRYFVVEKGKYIRDINHTIRIFVDDIPEK